MPRGARVQEAKTETGPSREKSKPATPSAGPTPAEAQAQTGPGPNSKESGSRGMSEGAIVAVMPASSTARAEGGSGGDSYRHQRGVMWGAWLLGVLLAVSGPDWGQTSLGGRSRGRGADIRAARPLATAPGVAEDPLIHEDAEAEDAGPECRKMLRLARYDMHRMTSEEAGGQPWRGLEAGLWRREECISSARRERCRPGRFSGQCVVATMVGGWDGCAMGAVVCREGGASGGGGVVPESCRKPSLRIAHKLQPGDTGFVQTRTGSSYHFVRETAGRLGHPSWCKGQVCIPTDAAARQLRGAGLHRRVPGTGPLGEGQQECDHRVHLQERAAEEWGDGADKVRKGRSGGGAWQGAGLLQRCQDMRIGCCASEVTP